MKNSRHQIFLGLVGLAVSLSLGWMPAHAKGKVQASNYVEPKGASTLLASTRPAKRDIASAQGFQSINTAPLPPISYFPLDKQNQTYLTQFILNYNKKINWEQANLMSDAILDFSQRYNIDYRLVTGVIAVESSFRTDAISSSGAIGLGQLKPDTAQWLGVGNPFDPIDNIGGASRYLSYLVSKYNGSLDHALSAYFQGPGSVDRNGITEVCVPYLQKVSNVLAKM